LSRPKPTRVAVPIEEEEEYIIQSYTTLYFIRLCYNSSKVEDQPAVTAQTVLIAVV